MNIATLLDMAAHAAPDRVIIGTEDAGLTYADLWARSNHAADVFAASAADNVVFIGTNSPLFAVSLFGSALSGRPFSPLNYRWADDLLVSAIERQSPALVIVSDEFASRVRALDLPDGARIVTGNEISAWSISSSPHASKPSDTAALALFTSGTSGAPKIAELGHDNLSQYVLNSVEFLGAEEGDCQLVAVPPYHIAGVANLLSSVYAGRRIVHLTNFDAEDWVELVRTQRVTNAMVVPTMLGRILEVIERPGQRVPDSLRHLSYGGGRMPLPLIEKAIALLPDVDFVNGYGLTETSSTITLLSPADHVAALAAAAGSDERARLGSVGRALPSVEITVRDTRGLEVEPRSVGEIWVRGPQVSGRYAGVEDDQQGGWFRTKDAGYLDSEGYLFLHGRLDDVIVRGGENISPGEVEDVLLDHPAVADVGVFALPDDEWGETVSAAVVVSPGATVTRDELTDWVRQRVRSAKTPTVIEFLEELPYNDAGKLLRRELPSRLATGQVVA